MGDADIVIIGAGVAGLAAAARVRQAGRSCVVLEASARIGGRAWTTFPAALGGVPFDQGAIWLHTAERNPLAAIARAASEPLHDASGLGHHRTWLGDRFAILRSLHHDSPGHVNSTHTMLTAYPGETVETPPFRAEEIDHARAGLKARGFSLTLAGLGTFAKGGRPVSLWVGVERNPQLDHLQNKIETALQRCGLEPERRRFSPHVTLARLDNSAEAKLAAYVQANNLFRAEPVPIEHFTLFSSRLGKDQAVYIPEVEYALAS